MARILRYFALLVLCLVLLQGLGTYVDAQSNDICSPYINAVEGGSASSVPIVSDKLLANWQGALPCLGQIINGMKDSVSSPKFKPEVQSKFLSTTGAIRAIMTTLSAADDKLKSLPADQKASIQDTLNNFSDSFRKMANLEMIAVLTYGARSDSYEVRLNSVLILGNIIDNRTVCVPLVQLYDKSGETEPNYANGRANLLAVISVVAPWAYFENYRNIERTKAFFSIVVKPDDPNPNLKTTREILAKIEQRLKFQTDKTNRNVRLPQAIKDTCLAYMKKMPPNQDLTANIIY